MGILAGPHRSIFQHSCETTTVGTTRKMQYTQFSFNSIGTTTTNDESLLEHRDVKRKCLLRCDPLCAVHTHVPYKISINQVLPFTQNKNKNIRKTTLTNGIYVLVCTSIYKYLHI